MPDVCPKCRCDVFLVDPLEEEWGFDPESYDEDAEVWLCSECNWSEEADPDEALDYHIANLDWINERLAAASNTGSGRP